MNWISIQQAEKTYPELVNLDQAVGVEFSTALNSRGLVSNTEYTITILLVTGNNAIYTFKDVNEFNAVKSTILKTLGFTA